MKEPTLEPQHLAKSCNEALILAALAAGPRHGYQLALDVESRSGGHFRFQHGTLYPILHKLEKEGLIAGVWSEAEGERRRKSYALTAKGRAYAEDQREAWRLFCARFFQALGEKA